MSFSYVADDVVVPLVGVKDEIHEESSYVDLTELQEQAVNLQRLVVSRSVARYGEGSVKVSNSSTVKTTGEKRFSIPKLIEWVSGEPDDLVAQLNQGRLRCRFSAAMGMGKSTYMPAYVARHCNMRVLYITVTKIGLQQSIDVVHDRNLGKFHRRWKDSRCTWMVGMTYADFNGYMASNRRTELFTCFDLIVFDEADLDIADVYCAKAFFAAYSLADTNLILCSATIKERESNESGGAAGLGNFRMITNNVTLNNAIASGKLVTDYLADRTILFLPDDDSVREAFEYYLSEGVDAFIMDSSASRDDFAKICDDLKGDSATPRVVSAHYVHGIGLNMPVSQPLIFPVQSAYSFEGDKVNVIQEPMTEEYITQCMSRSGRGIVEGSGGAVFGGERSQRTPLRESQKMDAFVRLFAGNIVPSRNTFAKQYELFPKGLDSFTAANLVKICLPVELAIRYFGSDGKVAASYQPALSVFSQPDTFLQPSKDKDPVGIESWKEDVLLGTEDNVVSVPMTTTGELQLTIQCIALLAQGAIEVKRWSPPKILDLDDGYDSSEERRERRMNKLPALRRIEHSVPVQKALPDIPSAWQYVGVGSSGPDSTRLNEGRYKDAVSSLNARITDFRVTEPEIMGFVVGESDSDDEKPVKIEYGTGSVESPGGGTICELPRQMCEKINVGTALSADEMIKLISEARADMTRFAESRLFDNFGKPWDCIIRTFAVTPVLQSLMKRGLLNDAYLLIDALRRRFTVEVTNVLASSNVYKTKFFALFTRLPSFDVVTKAIYAGKFSNIAQTDGFIDRVKFIKQALDRILLDAESIGVYLPNYITAAQKTMALRGENTLGYVGDGLQPMPRSWVKEIKNTVGGGSISFPRGNS